MGSEESNTNSEGNSSLKGRSVLITRSLEQSPDLHALLESCGASVICLPTIEIVDPDSWKECDASIWKLAEYDAVCFTSKNAVTKLLQRIRTIRPQTLNLLSTQSLYAVGVKTQSALETAGFSITAVPKDASAEELVRSFQGQNLSRKKILFPKSNIALGILPQQLRALGANVDEVIVYKTVIPEPENLEHVRRLLSEREIEIVTFFSPSSVQNLIEMIGSEILENISIAVIGPTTAEAVKEAGLEPVIIAQQHTAEGLADAIEKYFNKI